MALTEVGFGRYSVVRQRKKEKTPESRPLSPQGLGGKDLMRAYFLNRGYGCLFEFFQSRGQIGYPGYEFLVFIEKLR